MITMRDKAYKLLFDILRDDILAMEIEMACYHLSSGNKRSYSQKIRSIIYNLKNNSKFYDDVCDKKYSPEVLLNLEPSAINEDLWRPIYDSIEAKKRRIEKNTEKINVMCGI